MHPQPRVGIKITTRAYSPQVHRSYPTFPAQWFTAYNALSPVTGFLATVACAPYRRLDTSIGGRDHTPSPSAVVPLVSASHPRPPHPAPRFVTIASRPSYRGGIAGQYAHFLNFVKHYFTVSRNYLKLRPTLSCRMSNPLHWRNSDCPSRMFAASRLTSARLFEYAALDPRQDDPRQDA